MTEPEIMALVEILSRAPVTQAERHWLQSIINRLMADAQAAKAKQADGHLD